MADDITLTVRVRDATRRPLAELTQRLRRMERDLHGRSTSSNMFDRMGQSIQRFQNRLGTSNAFVGRFRRGLNNVVSGAVTPLRRAMDGLGNATRSAFRMGEQAVAGLRRGLTGAYGPLTRLAAGFWNLGQRMNNMLNTNQRWKAIIIATLALVGAAAQALGALLVTALGGAFIALGAFALRGSAQVKSAFKDLKSTVSSSVTDAAQPMETFLVSGIQQVTASVKQMQPALTEAFAAAGPLVENFFGAFTNFAASALPGFIKTLQSSQSTMAGFNDAMGQIGKGFGDMFSAMTANGGGEALGKVWETLGREIANLLVGIGEFINMSAKSGTATMLLVGVFRSFSGVLNVASTALSAIDAVFGGLFQNINSNLIGLDSLTGGAANLGTAFVAAGQDVGALKNQLADANKEIERIKKLRDDSLIAGPAKDEALKDQGATEDDLKKAQEKRKALLEAISTAENDTAKATQTHTASVKDLISKIQELNELNLANLDSRAAQEQAIDDAGEGYKKYAHALKMTNGELDVTTQSGRDAKDLLSKIASSTNSATKAAQDAHQPWQTVQGIWKTGREALIRYADGMGLTKTQATILADQILNMPDAKLTLRAETKQAVSDLQSFVTKVQNSPGSKSVTLKTLSARAEAILEGFGYKVKRLPDGSVKVTAATGTASSKLQYIQNMLASLDGTTARTYVETINSTIYQKDNNGKSLHDVVAAGRVYRGKAFAGGGIENHQAQIAPAGAMRVWAEPETGGESYIPLSVTKRARSRQIAATTVGMLGGSVQWFAKGGTTKAEKQARSDAASDLSISFFGKIAGFKRDEFVKALGLPESLGALVGDLNKWRGIIKKATHGVTESRLLKSLTTSGKALIQYEKQLTSTNKALEKAKDKLSDLKSSATQLKDSVKQGIISELNITRSAGAEDSQVTINTIMSQLTADASRAGAFESALATLKKKGVSGRVLEQISQAGVEGGGLETAQALLGASKEQISKINELNQSIRQSADDAGDIASDALYAAGIKAAEGLVKGLTTKQKSIENAMLKIAKSMEKAIKKALGIKSPSKVMQEVGHFTAEGFSVGMRKNSSPQKSWESMLNVPSTAGTGSSVGSGGQPMTVHVYFGNKEIGELVIDPLRRAISHRGGNVQATLGS